MILKFMSGDLKDAKAKKAAVLQPRPFQMPQDEPAPSANASLKKAANLPHVSFGKRPIFRSRHDRKFLIVALLTLFILAGILAYLFYPKIRAKYFPELIKTPTAPATAPTIETGSATDSVPAITAAAINDQLRKDRLPRLAALLMAQVKQKGVSLPTALIYWKLNDENDVVTLLREALNAKGENDHDLLDPRDPVYYFAYKSVDGKAFEMTAQLENLSDKDCDAEFLTLQKKCIYRYRVDAEKEGDQ